MFSCIMLRRRDHVLTLPRRDGFLGQAHLVRCAGFDFNEDDDLALLYDDVNFTIGSPRVAGDDFTSARGEMFGGNLFAPFADSLIVIHSRNSFNTERSLSSMLGLTGFVLDAKRL